MYCFKRCETQCTGSFERIVCFLRISLTCNRIRMGCYCCYCNIATKCNGCLALLWWRIIFSGYVYLNRELQQNVGENGQINISTLSSVSPWIGFVFGYTMHHTYIMHFITMLRVQWWCFVAPTIHRHRAIAVYARRFATLISGTYQTLKYMMDIILFLERIMSIKVLKTTEK